MCFKVPAFIVVCAFQQQLYFKGDQKIMEDTIFPTKWLTPRQASEHLGISKSTLDQLRIKGLPPAYVQRKDKGKVFYDITDLNKWYEKNKKKVAV